MVDDVGREVTQLSSSRPELFRASAMRRTRAVRRQGSKSGNGESVCGYRRRLSGHPGRESQVRVGCHVESFPPINHGKARLKRLLFKITHHSTAAGSKFAITNLGIIQFTKSRDIDSPYIYIDPSGRVMMYSTGEGGEYVIIVIWNHKDRTFSAWRTANTSEITMEVSSVTSSAPGLPPISNIPFPVGPVLWRPHSSGDNGANIRLQDPSRKASGRLDQLVVLPRRSGRTTSSN